MTLIRLQAYTPYVHGGLNVLRLLACLTAVHAVYWTDMRMRAPAMPGVVLLAVADTEGLDVKLLRRHNNGRGLDLVRHTVTNATGP